MMPREKVISPGPRKSPATVRSLQVRKQELVRDAIWDAAIDLFARKGFDETTIDDIAEAAGTSRRSFFRYFESKNDLLAQPIISFGKELSEAIQSCPHSQSTSEVFQETALRVARAAVSHPRTRKVMEIAAKCPAAREAQLARIAGLEDQLVEAFARRYKQRRNAVKARVLAGLTLSTVSVLCQCWFENGGKDISTIAGQVFKTLADVACDAAK
jgi:AcrR family transcriptional regulator